MCNSSGPVFPGVRVPTSLHTSARLPLAVLASPSSRSSCWRQSPSPVLSLCCLSVCLSVCLHLTSPHLTNTTDLSTHRRRRLLRPHRRSTFSLPPANTNTFPHAIICPIFTKEAVAGLVLRPSLPHDNSRLVSRSTVLIPSPLDTTSYAS
jgi:hypothetical protein